MAATSHTGSLAGADLAVDAVLKDCGVQRVDSVEELFDVALALARLPLPDGSRVGVLTNAGGPAILATDALVASGLEVAPLQDRTREKLRDHLVPEASVRNPVDMVASATAEDYRHCLRLMLADRTVDMLIVLFVPPITRDPVAVARAVFEEAKGSKKPVVGCFMSLDEVLATIAKEATQDWVPVYLYPESAVRALAALYERHRILERPTGKVRRFRADATKARAALTPGWLGVEERRLLSEAYRIPVVPGGLARSADEAVALADGVGYPVVLKVADPRAVHKSEEGGVLLELADEPAVRAAYRQLTRRRSGGVNVQKMLHGGREVVLGFTCDPTFGPLLMFGLGGVHVEVLEDVLEDVAFAPCPVTDVRARELVREIKGYPILRGIRGQPGVDEDALVEMIQRISQMALDHPELLELEMNPVMAFPGGAVSVDMRARVG